MGPARHRASRIERHTKDHSLPHQSTNAVSSRTNSVHRRGRSRIGRRSARVLSALATALWSLGSAHADDVEVALLASSDWMYRGISETGREPAAGLALDWQTNDTLFAGVEAHQGVVRGDPQRQRSVMLYVGAGASFGERWYVRGNVAHREYPGSTKEWDFTELSVQLDGAVRSNGKLHFSLSYSPDYYEHNLAIYAVEARYQNNWGRHAYSYLTLGLLESTDEAQLPRYGYSRLGTGVRWGNAVLDVSLRANTEGNDSSFGREAFSDPALVAEMTWRLR